MLYRSIVLPAITKLTQDDPEIAHGWALRALAGIGKEPALARTISQVMRPRFPRLTQNLWGLPFPNPIGLAAGFDKNAQAPEGCAALGFGFLEIGTITPKAQDGNARPRIFRSAERDALVNHMGFPSRGAKNVTQRLARMRKLPVPLGVSLGKMSWSSLEHAPNDYASCFRAAYPVCDYLVLNISSPNTLGLRDLHALPYLDLLLSRIREEKQHLCANWGLPPKPVLVKISPDITDGILNVVVDRCLVYGIDGIIAVNATTNHSERFEGGLSGKPLFPRALELVRKIFRQTNGKLPIIGAGGISSAENVYAMLKAGASLVQIYTALVYQGPFTVPRILYQLNHLLKRDGIENIQQIRREAAL